LATLDATLDSRPELRHFKGIQLGGIIFGDAAGDGEQSSHLSEEEQMTILEQTIIE
jgi:hypothetical protein